MTGGLFLWLMMLQLNDDKQRVLDATDLVRLIGDHIALRAKGREYVGLCPFHDDHSPSMFVVPHKQIYHCFSCGAGGNALSFVMNFHKMAFREALEYLAQRGGVKLTPWRPAGRSGAEASGDAEETAGNERCELLSANLTAFDFYRAILRHPEHGRAARDVIERRAISPEMVEQFGLGAAPEKWDGLALTIAHKQLPVGPFVNGGLLKAREGGSGLYDALRNRLVFPIHDQIGRVIGYGGRRLNDEDEPKYINSPESAVFDKSTTLYGLHQAAQEIRRTRLAIVTEGYMDTIACHQAGVKNAVATLGTALTPGNARVLRRLCDTVVLLFDGDEAGRRAADRAVEVFFAVPIDLKIAMLAGATDAKDPDELLKREGGAAVLQQIIQRAADPMTVLFRRVRASLEGQGLSAQTRLVDEFLARLVDLGLKPVDGEMRYQLIVKRLASITGVAWEAIADNISRRAAQRRARATGPAGSGPAAETARPTLGTPEHLLACVLCEPSLLLSLDEGAAWLADRCAESSPLSGTVAAAAARVLQDGGTPGLREVLVALEDPASQRLATGLAAEVERLTEAKPDRVAAHWRDRLASLRRELSEPRHAAPPAESGEGGGEGGAGEDGWSVNDEPEWATLERLRSLRRRLGDDPAAVPRPLTG